MQTEERNTRTQHIDQLPTLDVVRLMNDEDATIAAAVRQALPAIAQAVDVIVERLRRGGRLIYVGAGTSGRLAMQDAVECVPTFSTDPGLVRALIAGGDTALMQAIEGAEDDEEAGRADLQGLGINALDVVVGIAASGRTPYVVAALEAANEVGAATIGVACNMPAPIFGVASQRIAVPVGAEVIAGSTRLKAGTAQKMVLNMLSTTTMIQLGKVYGNLMVDLKVTNQKLVERARRMVAEVAHIGEEEAGKLLTLAGNEVKTAIVMKQRAVSADEARRLLREANGKLSGVIGESGV